MSDWWTEPAFVWLITLREKIADAQHLIWADWMEYLLLVSQENEDGTVTIPADKVTRWKRQINTDYCDLTIKEQASDLEQADKIFTVLSDG